MKNRNNKLTYKKDHKLAKLVCLLINTLLFILYFNLTNEFFKYILFFVANATYFFGVNSIGYLIESIRHHKHKHDII